MVCIGIFPYSQKILSKGKTFKLCVDILIQCSLTDLSIAQHFAGLACQRWVVEAAS